MFYKRFLLKMPHNYGLSCIDSNLAIIFPIHRYFDALLFVDIGAQILYHGLEQVYFNSEMEFIFP
jgi:hypothetical protein